MQGTRNSLCRQMPFLIPWMLVGLTFPASMCAESLPIDSAVSPSSEICSANAPVTNECVEAGLRTKRERLRAKAAFQDHTPTTHMQLGEFLSQQGDPNGAIEEYQAAIKLEPAMAEAYRGLGAVYIDTHQWSLAEDALRTSTRLDNTDSQTFYWLGRVLMAQHKFSAAMDAFITATELNPQDVEAFTDLGLVRMAQNHPLEAARALTQAIQLRPDYAEAHHRLEILQTSPQDPDFLPRAAREILNLLFRRD